MLARLTHGRFRTIICTFKASTPLKYLSHFLFTFVIIEATEIHYPYPTFFESEKMSAPSSCKVRLIKIFVKNLLTKINVIYLKGVRALKGVLFHVEISI